MKSSGDLDNSWVRKREKLLFEDQRTARKQYCCTECNRVIEAGSHYRISRLKQESSWATRRTCVFCCSLRSWLLVHTEQKNCAFGELYNELTLGNLISKMNNNIKDSECVWISNFPDIEIEEQYPLLIRLKQEATNVNSN